MLKEPSERAIPDELHERTITFPVRIIDGRPEPFYGPTWPQLRDRVVADLVLPASAFVNPRDEALLSAPLGTDLLPVGTQLFAVVSDAAVGEGFFVTDDRFFTVVPHGRLVPFELAEPLGIQLRGTKRARLEPCRRHVPSLKNTYDSVNETYTRISEHHEPHRRSHTGNVFEKVLYLHEFRNDREIWCPLDDLRQSLEMTLERRFQQRRDSKGANG